jgi:hypothetical protein
MRSHFVEGRKMKSNKAQFIFIVIGIMISVMACASGGQSNPEVEALQEQVNALATQNALLVEKIEDSSSGSASGEADAPQPPAGDLEPQVAMSTPTPESLPTEPVKAGTPIIYDGWSMTVAPEIISRGGGTWGIKIYVRNLGDTSRVFRYTMASITLRDNIGNSFKYQGSEIYQYLDVVRNINISGQGSIKLISGSPYSRYWHFDDQIQSCAEPIPLEASQIIIGFDNFGPFTGVEVIIDL